MNSNCRIVFLRALLRRSRNNKRLRASYLLRTFSKMSGSSDVDSDSIARVISRAMCAEGLSYANSC